MLSLTVPGKSWLHKLPAGAKLACLSVATVALLSVRDWTIVLAATLAVAALYLSVSTSFAAIGAKRLKPLVYLLAIIFAYHVITSRALEGATVCFRLFATVGLANLVTMTSRLDDMMAVVDWLTKPLVWLGMPPRTLGFALGLVVRFTPIFLSKGRLLRDAWKARSAKKVSPRLMVPLALGALDDADRVADALRARGGLITPDTSTKPGNRP